MNSRQPLVTPLYPALPSLPSLAGEQQRLGGGGRVRDLRPGPPPQAQHQTACQFRNKAHYIKALCAGAAATSVCAPDSSVAEQGGAAAALQLCLPPAEQHQPTAPPGRQQSIQTQQALHREVIVSYSKDEYKKIHIDVLRFLE